jgi:PAS domain S-box-containing protein
MPFVCLAADATIRVANRKWLELLDLRAGEVRGQSLRAFLVESQRPVFDRCMSELLEKGSKSNTLLKMRTGAGDHITCEFEGRVGYDAEGRATHTCCVCRDVSESVQAQRRVDESERRLSLITDSIPAAIYQYRVDAEGKHALTYISRNAEPIFGFTVDRLMNERPMFQHVHEEDLPGFLESIERSFSQLTDWHHEYRVRRCDGTTAWIRARSTPVQTPDGGVIWNGVLADVTVEKEAQLALQQSEARLRSVVDAMPHMLFELDRDGTIIAYWGAARDDLFMPPEDFVGRRAADVSPGEPAAKTAEALARIFDGEHVVSFTYSVTMHGREEHYEAVMTRMSPDRVMNVVRTITDRVERERQLREFARQLQEIREDERSQMARDIHDIIGQSLTAVGFDLQWILRHGATGETASRVQRALDQVDGLSDEVKRIGTLLRPRILDDFGLAAALEWLAAEFTDRYGIRVTPLEIDESPICGAEAATQLFRIAQEALTNIARHSRASSAGIALHDSDGETRMVISDDGVGIPAGSTQDALSGGLVGMRERARAVNGSVEFQTGRGSGTRVVVTVPWRASDS